MENALPRAMVHPAMRTPDEALDATLDASLTYWFDCFDVCSAEWGLVDYWRDDGTCYKRHGMVMTLGVNLASVLEARRGLGLLQLREAVDLVQLMLVAQPSASKVLLEKGKYIWQGPTDISNELGVISRGVPVELRLRFEVDMPSTKLLDNYQLLLETNGALDTQLSTNESFLALRRALLARVDHDGSKLLQLNHNTVRGVLAVENYIDESVTTAEFVKFLENLTAYSERLTEYQRDRGAATAAAPIATRHTPVEIEKIHMGLVPELLSPTVMESAAKLIATGLPVEWFALHLDMRLVQCDEDHLRTFLNIVTERSPQLRIDTIESSDYLGVLSIDEYGGDYREHIRMLLRALASVAGRVSELMIDGLLRLCRAPRNREAIWRGLFEDILLPEAPLRKLRLADSTPLGDDDAVWIERLTSEWRVAHPDQKLRASSIDLRFGNASTFRALSALLAAFDDVEEIHIISLPYGSPISRDIFDALLRFPSLRKLYVRSAVVPSMDLFDPSSVNETHSAKPVLEELELNEVVLEDVSSLQRFFRSLNPSVSTSPLATTLQKLHVTQRDERTLNPVDFYDSSTVTTLNDMLRSNRILTNVTVTNVSDLSVREEMDALTAHDGDCIPVPWRSSDAGRTQAGKAAFLSIIFAPSSVGTSARSQIDTSLIRLILAFAAPHVTRKIRKLSHRSAMFGHGPPI